MAVADKEAQKKMIGELLKNADKYIKSAEWSKAMEEVGKALAIEPNNMYAMAYKDRINASIAAEKKKADEEKVKKLSEEKKPAEKPAEPVKDEKAPEPSKQETAKTETAKEEKKSEPSKSEPAKTEVKNSSKDESAARIDSLRQEFTATQAKLQREVAQLTMQVKEAQALKEATEKGLNAQIVSLQQDLAAAKSSAGKNSDKEVEALKKELETVKARHQKDIDTAKEIARAEMIAQVATLQKELETVKNNASASSLKVQGETLLHVMFQKAWQDGVISADERAMMVAIKEAIEMNDEKFNTIEKSSKNEAYVNALRSVWSDGSVTPDESDFLTALREKLGIPAEEHFKLEGKVRKELKK